MNSRFKILFLILTFWSCSNSEKKLFLISEPNENRNDLLYLAESTNVLPISDSLINYLTIQELAQAEKVTYKNHGEIYKNENFKANIILRIGSKTGRDYRFILRTYKLDGGVIDSYQLAKWVEQDKEFCYGSISEQLIINRNCENKKNIMQISQEGRIIAATYTE